MIKNCLEYNNADQQPHELKGPQIWTNTSEKEWNLKIFTIMTEIYYFSDYFGSLTRRPFFSFLFWNNFEL